MATAKKNLTHRQWLNIITLVTAFMMLVFVMVGRLMEQKLQPVETAEQPFAELERLVIGNWQAQLTPQGWQQQPNWLEPEQLNQMLSAWQQFSPQAWSNQTDFPVVLPIVIHRRQQTQHWQLLLGDYPMLKNRQQTQAMLLSNSEFRRLFPAGLLQHWKAENN